MSDTATPMQAPEQRAPAISRRTLWLAFLLAPPLAVMALFVVWPIVSALAYAFYDWQGLRRGEFVGFGNFYKLFFQEPFATTTWNAFKNNVIIFFALMVIQNGLGFVLAYCLWRELPGARFHRVAVFLPVVLSTVIIGYLWKLFFHPLFGVVNQSLKAIGLGSLAQPWLGQADTALWALIFTNAWAWVGFPTLVFLAGMQRIPGELLDAARMETASEWRVVKEVVWPLIAPSTTVVFILLFIGAFNFFELPYIMMGVDGSPYGSTDVLGLYFYRAAFGNQSAGISDFGLGSALAVVMFLFIGVVATLWTLHLRKRELDV